MKNLFFSFFAYLYRFQNLFLGIDTLLLPKKSPTQDDGYCYNTRCNAKEGKPVMNTSSVYPNAKFWFNSLSIHQKRTLG